MKLSILYSFVFVVTAILSPAYGQSPNERILKDIINRMDKNELCPRMNYTIVTVRQKNTRNGVFRSYSYTAQGYANLDLKRNKRGIRSLPSRGEREGFLMRFSDRDNFKGNQDLITVDIDLIGSKVGVKIVLVTWGGGEVFLKKVNVHETRFGYFITGEAKGGNSSSLVTIAIYKEFDCLI